MRSDLAMRASRAFPRPRTAVLWPLGAALVTVAVATSRLLVTPRFYYADDTQTGTAGQWWRLGEQLLDGRLPILDVHAWTAGNLLAEGQWGVLNPAIWLVAVIMRVAGQPLVVVTVVKIAALAVMATGAYALARSFGASRPWAAAAGVLVPLGGFTVYLDAASWTTGLLASAAIPWAWYGLRGYVDRGRGPGAFLVSTALLITLGYVFGVIVLVTVFVEMLIRAVVGRDRKRTGRILLAGVFSALVSVAVYLPAMLTAPVTIRNSTSIANFGFLNADFTDLFATSTATATASIGAWETTATYAPVMYALWAVPAVLLFLPSRRRLRSIAPLLWVGAVLVLIVTGPDQIGPIRWPVRFMPYLVLVACVSFAVIASGRRARSPRRSLSAALVALAALSWVTVADTPWEWRQIAVAAAVQVAGVVAVWWFIRGPAYAWRGASALAPAVVASIGAVLVVPQMYFFPSTPLPQPGFGGEASPLAEVPGEVPDDAIVVGDIYAGWLDPAIYEERLIGNEWYFSDTTVSSLYTVLPYRAYVEDLCADLRGSTCGAALDTLASEDAITGRDVAGLLGVNTIIVMKNSFDGRCPDTPAGWTLWADRNHTCVLTRAQPVPTAGGVAWAGTGTRVHEVSRSETDLSFEVDEVGEDARVVLSRLDWPGYRIDGASGSDSVRGYLLTVDVASAQPGDVVTVSFRPPGWAMEVAALVAAIALAIGWPVTRAIIARRPRGQRSAPRA